MQITSELYQNILAVNHWKEVRLVIGDEGLLVDERGNILEIGGYTFIVDSGEAENGYDESVLVSMSTNRRVFSEDVPSVGCCVAGEIDVKMRKPVGDIPRMARLVPYVRLTDGTRHSEWIQKGEYFIDTRKTDRSSDNVEWLTLHGYDSMLKSETGYPSSAIDWPANDTAVLQEIASAIGVEIDERTYEQMTHGYRIQYPADYSCREVLGHIASAYAGNFIMSDEGKLLLITLNSLPPDTSYLITSGEDRRPITFGGDRILV